jgi:hypothetical protein
MALINSDKEESLQAKKTPGPNVIKLFTTVIYKFL